MRDYMTARCAAIDSGLIDCYSLSGPYPITFIADDPFRGDIQINSIVPTSYPFSGDYFGGVTVNLKALAKNGGIFMGWDSQVHTLSPSNDSLNVTLNLNAGDTIYAYFSATGVPQLNEKTSAFSIYPSLSQDAFNAVIPGTENDRYTLSISNLHGQHLFSKQVNGKKNELFSASQMGLKAGVYLVTLNGLKGKQTQKLVVLPE